MQVLVIASEKYYHCLNPFMYLWNKYFGWQGIDIIVCVFSEPHFVYKENCGIYSVGDQADWPPQRFSEKLLKILDGIAEEQFILMLEDYWITRPVDRAAVRFLFDYAAQFENVLKIDLTYDRLYLNAGSDFLFGANTYDNCAHLDLLKSPFGSPYQMSLWGGIWNREQFKKVLVPGETAQEIETKGTSRVAEDQLVLGTRQAPMLHGNIYQSRYKGEPCYNDIGWRIKDVDLEFMQAEGWLKDGQAI
jgi:hypothetical protein